MLRADLAAFVEGAGAQASTLGRPDSRAGCYCGCTPSLDFLDSDETDDATGMPMDPESLAADEARRLAEIDAAEREEADESKTDEADLRPNGQLLRFHTLMGNIKTIVAYFRGNARKRRCLREAQRRAIAGRAAPLEATTQQPEWEKPISQPLKLVQHNATRWNSKVRMLIRYCRLHEYVREVLHDDSAPTKVVASLPADADVEELKATLPILVDVLKATDVLQGDKYPTLGLVLPLWQDLRASLATSQGGTDSPGDPPMAVAVKDALWTDIDKRFTAMLDGARLRVPDGVLLWMHPAMTCATLLTPKYKSVQSLYKYNRDDAKRCVEQLIASFCKKGECPVVSCPRHRDHPGEVESKQTGPDIGHLDGFCRPRSAGSCIELQNYIREPYPSSERWSSAWWKACSPKFPHVAWAARKILCVPATSASVGRFSSCIWHGKLPLKSRKAIERVEKMALLSYNDPKEWHWNQM